MKTSYLITFLIVAILALMIAPVFSAPFIVSDPDPSGAADKCVYQVGAATAVETPTAIVPPQLTGGCKIDAAPFAAGTTNMQVWFKSTLWGVETAKVPFAFTKPAAGSTGPQNLRLEP